MLFPITIQSALCRVTIVKILGPHFLKLIFLTLKVFNTNILTLELFNTKKTNKKVKFAVNNCVKSFSVTKFKKYCVTNTRKAC